MPSDRAATPILIVPGWQNSGPAHWQSLWERAHPHDYWRVEQADWETPRPEEWVGAIDGAVIACARPPVLVAHSLGCIAVVRWALGRPGATAAGALLVAPADVERDGAPAAITPFAPVPLAPLPFPATVVASQDDPYLSIERARAFAEAWRATFADAGRAGHLNAAAGFGPWPAGERLLEELLARVRGARGNGVRD